MINTKKVILKHLSVFMVLCISIISFFFGIVLVHKRNEAINLPVSRYVLEHNGKYYWNNRGERFSALPEREVNKSDFETYTFYDVLASICCGVGIALWMGAGGYWWLCCLKKRLNRSNNRRGKSPINLISF